MTFFRHGLSAIVDPRLRAYGGTSWNAHEAIYTIGQIASLIPAYERNLESIYGRSGIGDARRLWGMVADLVSAVIDVPPTMEGLSRAGFEQARSVGYVLANVGPFALAGSRVMQSLDFTQAATGNMIPLLAAADEHDRLAKPMQKALLDELRAYEEHLDELAGERQIESLRDLARALDPEPQDFPLWDKRPMFLDEQKLFLEYLIKAAAAELVADHLVDERLGEFFLRVAGVMQWSEVLGEAVLDINVVPHELLKKPASLVAHQAGNAILDVLRVFDRDADPLDRLYVVEMAVKTELNIDISPALATNRAKLVDESVAAFETFIIDLRDPSSASLVTPLSNASGIQLFEFPEFS